MKLWISGEITADFADSYRGARKRLEESVNEMLKSLPLRSEVLKWAFIAIIRPDHHADYAEFSKRHLDRKVLEFRLKIDHQKFLVSSPAQQATMILEALDRSVEMMAQMGIEEGDRAHLKATLESTKASLAERVT